MHINDNISVNVFYLFVFSFRDLGGSGRVYVLFHGRDVRQNYNNIINNNINNMTFCTGE